MYSYMQPWSWYSTSVHDWVTTCEIKFLLNEIVQFSWRCWACTFWHSEWQLSLYIPNNYELFKVSRNFIIAEVNMPIRYKWKGQASSRQQLSFNIYNTIHVHVVAIMPCSQCGNMMSMPWSMQLNLGGARLRTWLRAWWWISKIANF